MKVYFFFESKLLLLSEANNSGVMLLGAKIEPALSRWDFQSGKKATTRFKENECSQAHRNAAAAHISSRSTPINKMLQRYIDDSKGLSALDPDSVHTDLTLCCR